MKCSFCFDSKKKLICLDCKHSICQLCLHSLFQTGLKDIFKLPLTCCGKPIPKKCLQEVCSKNEWQKYQNFMYALEKLHFEQTKPNQDLEEIKQKENWSTCPKCFNCIERIYGCNKMTCVCKVVFCYACEKCYDECKCVGMYYSLFFLLNNAKIHL